MLEIELRGKGSEGKTRQVVISRDTRINWETLRAVVPGQALYQTNSALDVSFVNGYVLLRPVNGTVCSINGTKGFGPGESAEVKEVKSCVLTIGSVEVELEIRSK